MKSLIPDFILFSSDVAIFLFLKGRLALSYDCAKFEIS